MKTPEPEAQRRRVIAWAIALTADASLTPPQDEANLLAHDAQGS